MNGNLILTLPLALLGAVAFFAFWKMVRAAKVTDEEMDESNEWSDWDWEGDWDFYIRRREITTVAEDD